MKISVIIPVYNAASFLDKSIMSALDQKQTGEVLLIDDRSTDDSLEMCKRWERKDSRVKVFVNKGTKGAGAARNVGLRHATCDYIAFLDADDYYLEGRFDNTQKFFLENLEIYAVGEGVLVIDQNTSINEKIVYNKSTEIIDLKYFMIKSPIHLNGLTLRKSSLKFVKYFNETLIQTQDSEFIIDLIHKSKVLSGYNNEVVSTYIIHDSNTTKNENQRNLYRRLFYKNHIIKSIFEFHNIRLFFYFFKRYLYYDFLIESKINSNHTKIQRLLLIPKNLINLIIK